MSSNVSPASEADAFTRNALVDGFNSFSGTKYEHTQPYGQTAAPTPTPTPAAPEQNPFQALAPTTPTTQSSAPTQNFDALVDSILNEPAPVQGADTPMTPEVPKADKPKQSPLFGDLNVHIQPNTTPLTQEDRDRNAMSPRESIF